MAEPTRVAVAVAGGRQVSRPLLPVPHGKTTELTEDLLKYDVDVSWWVTSDAYEQGYYTKLYAALRHWLADAFPFTMPYFSNIEIPERDDA